MGIREDWNDKILVFDGGMGSLLQGAGLKPGELPETWNIKHPEVLVKIHEDYLNAGANIILSNTFGANRLKYNEAAEFNLDEIVDAAMKNARTAVEHCGRGYVALDLGPTGRLLKPMGDLDFEEAVSIYTEVVKAGVRGGADHQRFPRGIDDELQMSGIQFFFKFAVGLKCHLDEVNVGKFKLHIAGACLGCLDEVFNQCFETL